MSESIKRYGVMSDGQPFEHPCGLFIRFDDPALRALVDAASNTREEWDALIAHRVAADIGVVKRNDAWRAMDLKRWSNLADALDELRDKLAPFARGQHTGDGKK